MSCRCTRSEFGCTIFEFRSLRSQELGKAWQNIRAAPQGAGQKRLHGIASSATDRERNSRARGNGRHITNDVCGGINAGDTETTGNVWITLSEPVKRVARWVALNCRLIPKICRGQMVKNAPAVRSTVGRADGERNFKSPGGDSSVARCVSAGYGVKIISEPR